MYACLCRAVTEKSVRDVVAAGASTVSEVRATCGAGTGCGGCLPSLRRLLRECQGPTLACTAAATLDPGAGIMESTCSGNCATEWAPEWADGGATVGEPICVAGLGDQMVAFPSEAGGLAGKISLA